MITTDKVTEMFCILDEFCKNLDAELTKNLHIAPIDEGYKRMRNRKGQMPKSEIMTILLCYHFGSFRNFKHYYLFFIKEHMACYFPKAVSYMRFVELIPFVFFELMAFMRIQGFGKCTGISFVDSTMIPVCHNMRRNFNKVFDGFAKNGKGTMGWCHGFKLHLLCNEMGDVLTFCLTPANVDEGTLGCGRSSPRCSTAKYLPIRATSNNNSLRTSSTKASTSFMGSNQT